MSTNPESIRFSAKQDVADEAASAVEAAHEKGYSSLYVYRDGTVHWNWPVDQNEGRIEHAGVVAKVTTVGTGDQECDCGECDKSSHFNHEIDLEHAVDRICEQGYFDDEDVYTSAAEADADEADDVL